MYVVVRRRKKKKKRTQCSYIQDVYLGVHGSSDDLDDGSTAMSERTLRAIDK